MDTTESGFNDAFLGKAWTGQVDVVDTDDTVFHWQLVQAPAGMTLQTDGEIYTDEKGRHHSLATLQWMPGKQAMAHNNVIVRVLDGHGNAAMRTFQLHVDGGDHAPLIGPISLPKMKVGQNWSLPLMPSDHDAGEKTAVVSDADGDVLTIYLDNLPPGAHYDAKTSVLSWTPVPAQAGRTYRDVTISASDGITTTRKRFYLSVTPVDQKLALVPVKPQKLHVGEKYCMQLRMRLPDSLGTYGDKIIKPIFLWGFNTLYHKPPAGMQLGSISGQLMWTPGKKQIGSHHVKFQSQIFRANIYLPFTGQTGTVDFDVFEAAPSPTERNSNCRPSAAASATGEQRQSGLAIHVDNHVVIANQTITLPIHKDSSTKPGIGITGVDPSQPLSVRFVHLPKNAKKNQRINAFSWTPRLAQLGVHRVVVQVENGDVTRRKEFDLDVESAGSDALAPRISMYLPKAQVLPYQDFSVDVEVKHFAPLVDGVIVQARGTGLGTHRWQTLQRDRHGKYPLHGTQPGKISLRVVATNIDGHGRVVSRSIYVKNPASTHDLDLSWGSALQWASKNSTPTALGQATIIKIKSGEPQALGYRLTIAPAGSDQWQLLSRKPVGNKSWTTHGGADAWTLQLAKIDPKDFYSGAYRLRLVAWDRDGQSSELETHVLIEGRQQALAAATAVDTTFRLGGHDFSLARILPVAQSNGEAGNFDFGNWQQTGFDSHLTTDQRSGSAWAIGAHVWLTLPVNLVHPAVSVQPLEFTLTGKGTALFDSPDAPVIYRAAFSGTQGWALRATNGKHLLRKHNRLYDEVDGKPWSPEGYLVTAPGGTRYALGIDGKITDVFFPDGTHWLLSTSGIALARNATARIRFRRGSKGRIIRATGSGTAGSVLQTLSYRYDGNGRLRLVHTLGTGAPGTSYVYDAQGRLCPASRAPGECGVAGKSGGDHLSAVVTSKPPTTLTHTDLAVRISLDTLAQGLNGGPVFWHVVKVAHGSAVLAADGQSVVFTPVKGFSGKASLTLGVDGSGSVTLPIKVSDAPLVAIHLRPMKGLMPGFSLPVDATLDFADQKNVGTSADPGYLRIAASDLRAMKGLQAAQANVDDANDRMHIVGSGPAILTASHSGVDGTKIQTVEVLNVLRAPTEKTLSERFYNPRADWPLAELLAYPDLWLQAGASQQLHVKLLDPNDGSLVVVSPSPSATATGGSQIRYLSSNPAIATANAAGEVAGHKKGSAVVSVLYLYDWGTGGVTNQSLSQTNVTVHVGSIQTLGGNPTNTPPGIHVKAGQAIAIQDVVGDAVMIGSGVLPADTRVGIRPLDISGLSASMAMPGPGVLQILAAFHLEIGSKDTQSRIQAAITDQSGRARSGTRVLFLRKATVMVPAPKGSKLPPTKSTKPSWWLVSADGYISKDGKLHPGRNPLYGGLTASGDYVVCQVLPGVRAGRASVEIGRGQWITFDGLHISLAPGRSTKTFEGRLMGILIDSSSSLSMGSYLWGEAHFKTIPAPKVPPGKNRDIISSVDKP